MAVSIAPNTFVSAACLSLLLAGCGAAETATTAKLQAEQAEQAQKQMEQLKQQIDQTNAQSTKRLEEATKNAQ